MQQCILILLPIFLLCDFTKEDSRDNKIARRCKPGSLHIDLIVLFSWDPLSSVRSFSS